MLRLGAKGRTIHIHVGPHKTGSTAIQQALDRHADGLIRAVNVKPILDSQVHALALAMNKRDEARQEQGLADLLRLSKRRRGDIVLSCEDFVGDLPGRGSGKRVYPQLWPNLNRLRRAFPHDHVRFYFFVREPQAWLRSAYVQHLKHRTTFKSYDGYIAAMRDLDAVWDGVLERPRQRLGENFVEIPYEDSDSFSAERAFFQAALGDEAAALLPADRVRANTSPPEAAIRMLEVANRSGASAHAVQGAKNFLLGKSPPHRPDLRMEAPDWPPRRVKPDWLAPDLEALWSRVAWRAAPEEQANLLPDPSADLSEYRTRLIDPEGSLPDIGRGRMEDQSEILEHRLSGLPWTCHLLGLTISYLRRKTEHSAAASHMFQRLWREEYPILLGFLPTRWLISTFQTFLDHGVNDDQRTIGAAGFFFSNTVKMYEAERALDGLPPDRPYPNTTPVTKGAFWGLDRYAVGGTDLLLNTNALLLELAAREPVAGRVAQEFLLRVKRYESAFSRMDRSRLAHDINTPPFLDCWSFFESPDKKK